MFVLIENYDWRFFCARVNLYKLSLLLRFLSRRPLSTTGAGHLGLILAINLVKQSTKYKQGSNGCHRFDLVPKHNRRQANTKHLSRRHDNSKHNWTKLW